MNFINANETCKIMRVIIIIIGSHADLASAIYKLRLFLKRAQHRYIETKIIEYDCFQDHTHTPLHCDGSGDPREAHIADTAL